MRRSEIDHNSLHFVHGQQNPHRNIPWFTSDFRCQIWDLLNRKGATGDFVDASVLDLGSTLLFLKQGMNWNELFWTQLLTKPWNFETGKDCLKGEFPLKDSFVKRYISEFSGKSWVKDDERKKSLETNLEVRWKLRSKKVWQWPDARWLRCDPLVVSDVSLYHIKDEVLFSRVQLHQIGCKDSFRLQDAKRGPI